MYSQPEQRTVKLQYRTMECIVTLSRGDTLVLSNIGVHSVYFGFNGGVDSFSGFPLVPGASYAMNRSAQYVAIYVYADRADSEISYMRVSELGNEPV